MLKNTAWPPTPQKVLAAMNSLKVDMKGLRGGPLEWTKDNHFRTRQYYRVWRWDPAKSAIVRVQDWQAIEREAPLAVQRRRVQLAINIAVLAAIYALICCGYVLIYRVSRVLSLAHGELMMLGAYGLLRDRVAVRRASARGDRGRRRAGGAGRASLVYLALMWRMTGESVLAAVLATIALGILLRGAMILVVRHADAVSRCSTSAGATLRSPVGASARISAVGLAARACAPRRSMPACSPFCASTRWGIRMRAAGQNPLLAAQRGIGLHGIYALAWGLATFTGGAGRHADRVRRRAGRRRW